MRRTLAFLFSLFPVLSLAAHLSALQTDPAGVAPLTTVLYDSESGTAPGEQGFTFFAFGASVVEAYRDGSTVLDTTAEISEVAGYLSQQELPLDRQLGYKLHFVVQVAQEEHLIRHRAGFSVLVVSDDLQGIEIAFWPDELFVQSGSAEENLFRRAESAIVDTASGLVPYDLTVLGDTYTLSASGTPILSGALRDYTPFDGFPDPYESPNVIFLGDNTRRGAAEVVINRVVLETNSLATPTPQATATLEPTLTPTALPSPTAALEPSPTTEPSATPIATLEPAATLEPTATWTSTPVATAVASMESTTAPVFEAQPTPQPSAGWLDKILAFLQELFSGSGQ